MEFVDKLRKLNYYDKIDIVSFIIMFGGIVASMWYGGEIMSIVGFSFSFFILLFFAIPLSCYFIRLLILGFASIVISLVKIAKNKDEEH